VLAGVWLTSAAGKDDEDESGVATAAVEEQAAWRARVLELLERFELPRRDWGGSARVRSRRGLQAEAGAGVHHRCPSAVHGGDDLLGGDSLQVGAGRREV
jgi:hypothetical protein